MDTLPISVAQPDGSDIVIDIGNDTTVKDVINKISPSGDIGLTFEGNTLELDDNILSYGLSAGSEVVVVLSRRAQAIARLGENPTKEAAAAAFAKEDGACWVDYFLAGADVNATMPGYSGPPLWVAVTRNKIDIVRELIKLKEIDLSGPSYRTSMRTPLIQSITLEFNEISKMLIEAGAKIERQTSDNETALYVAAWYGNLPIVKMLLQRGAVIDASERTSMSPLRAAVKNGHDQVVRLLLDSGASLHEHHNISVLEEAVKNSHIPMVELLISRGSEVNFVMRYNHMKETLIYCAVLKGCVPIIKLLVENGASVNVENSVKQTPLHIASAHSSLAVCEYLLEAGAEINVLDKCNSSPLMYACMRDDDEIAKLLISKGADPEVTNVNGATPYSIARHSKHRSLVKMLPSDRPRCCLQ